MTLVPVLVMAIFALWFVAAKRGSSINEPNRWFGGEGNSDRAKFTMTNPVTALGRRLDRRPYLPTADRAPQGITRLNGTVRDDYITDGMRAVQIHLMQAARGTGWATER